MLSSSNYSVVFNLCIKYVETYDSFASCNDFRFELFQDIQHFNVKISYSVYILENTRYIDVILNSSRYAWKDLRNNSRSIVSFYFVVKLCLKINRFTMLSTFTFEFISNFVASRVINWFSLFFLCNFKACQLHCLNCEFSISHFDHQ